MIRKLSALFAGAMLCALAFSQSVPNGGITQGQIWTLAQWQAAWPTKADVTSGTLNAPTINGPIISNPTISNGTLTAPTISNPTVTGTAALQSLTATSGVFSGAVSGSSYSGGPISGTTGTFTTITQNGTQIPTFPRTASEISAGVTPVSFNFQPGNALRYGADPTGSADSTAALQAAINVSVNGVALVPPGSYKFSSLTFAGLANVLFQCADRSSTHLIFTGTGNAITISQAGNSNAGRIAIRGCDIAPSALQSSGSIINIVDDFFVRIEDNSFQSANAFNDISVTCSANTPNQVHIAGNQIFSAVNDGISLSCANASFSVSDIFIEPGLGQRNYIKGAGRAGIEISGSTNGILILSNTIFNNATGILGTNSGLGNSAFNSNTITGNDIDTNTVANVNFTGFNASQLNSNHIFGAVPGVTCTACVNINAVGNHYEGAGAGLALLGTLGWSDTGSHFAGMSAPVSIGPNGSTASADISIVGAQYVDGIGPFLTFAGSSNPAVRIIGSVELGTSATACTSGTNALITSFMFMCGNTILQGLLTPANGTDTNTFATNVSGVGSVTVYNGSANSAAQSRLYLGNNTSAGEGFIGITGGNFSGPFPANDLVVLSNGTLDLSFDGDVDLRVNSSGVTFGAVPVNLNNVTGGGTATKFVCVDASGNIVIQAAAC